MGGGRLLLGQFVKIARRCWFRNLRNFAGATMQFGAGVGRIAQGVREYRDSDGRGLAALGYAGDALPAFEFGRHRRACHGLGSQHERRDCSVCPHASWLAGKVVIVIVLEEASEAGRLLPVPLLIRRACSATNSTANSTAPRRR